MEEIIILDEICRLCLTSKTKESSLLLFKITDSKQIKFEELTQVKLPLNEAYPARICADCSDKLENFYFYKSQLIIKQDQLSAILTEAYNLQDNLQDDPQEVEEDTELIEEYLDFDGDEHIVEVITLPSVKHLRDPTDNEAIVKLIDEIEEKNQMILDCSNSHTMIKRRKISNTDEVKKSRQKKTAPIKPVDRNEELKFEKQVPKLIMRPAGLEDQTSKVSTVGIVLFTCDKKCQECGLDFSSSFQLKRHQLSSHQLQEPVSCCDQVFKFNSDLKKHRISAHPKTVVCPFCQKVLRSKKTFMVHKKTHQNVSERQFKCPYPDCVKAFNFKLHLDNHERTHSGERPFKCNLCPISFKQKYQLTIHKRKHEGIVNKCSTCDHKFLTSSQRNKHEKTCSLKNIATSDEESSGTEL